MAWLRNKSGMKIKTGVLHQKRVEYFKGVYVRLEVAFTVHGATEPRLRLCNDAGKSAIKALLSPAYAKVKGAKKIASEEEAIQFLQSAAVVFFVRVARGHSISASGPQGVKGPSMKVLEIDQKQVFEPDQYYVWFLAPSQLKTMLGGVAMVAVILAGVMFPLWPTKLRIGVWYLSMAMLGVIGLFFALSIFRLIFYVITIVVAKPGIWIFPNLFADVGFVSVQDVYLCKY